jgi:hypothetical protein
MAMTRNSAVKADKFNVNRSSIFLTKSNVLLAVLLFVAVAVVVVAVGSSGSSRAQHIFLRKRQEHPVPVTFDPATAHTTVGHLGVQRRVTNYSQVQSLTRSQAPHHSNVRGMGV